MYVNYKLVCKVKENEKLQIENPQKLIDGDLKVRRCKGEKCGYQARVTIAINED